MYDTRYEPSSIAARYAAHGVRAFISLPLFRDDEWRMQVWISDNKPRTWSSGDVALLRELADRIWLRLERARAESALRETQARLEEALTTARMAYWTWDPRTKSTVSSRSLDALFGLRDGETLSSRAQRFQIVHAEDQKRHRDLVESAAARGEGWHTEFRVVRPRDGEVAWLEERATVTRDALSGEMHTTGLVWDVTDRKRVEAAADLERRALDRETMRRALASAEESERRRLARDLHDQLGQHLTAFALGLAEARRLLDAGQPAQERLTQLEDLARVMAHDARYLALQLRPPELDDVGLESALQSYVEQWSTRYGVSADVAVTGAEANRLLPSDVSAAVYRIAQEALTNVAKHAEARQVSVVLERPEREVRLIVEDDGRGFDLDVIGQRVQHERSIGLESMRERVALIGGTLEVESSLGRGTTIYVRAPISANAHG
jgi:PAS domain S-box-containing protein